MSKKYLSTKNKNLYNKIINFFTKKGNKVKATKIVNEAFGKVSKETGLSFNSILSKLFSKLNSFVEVKKIRVRRGFHLVPFPISHKRSTYLIIKWLIQAIKEDKRKISFSDKLFSEINQTISSSSSKSLEIKTSNISQVLSNRSNIHFRW
jgi:small subunit ribosomal protein S7